MGSESSGESSPCRGKNEISNQPATRTRQNITEQAGAEAHGGAGSTKQEGKLTLRMKIFHFGALFHHGFSSSKIHILNMFMLLLYEQVQSYESYIDLLRTYGLLGSRLRVNEEHSFTPVEL